MSEHADHKHADGEVHVHVHPWKFYAGILGALLTLTILTIAASWIDIDRTLALGREVHGVGAWNLTLALLIASTKATLVVLFFMHLKDDARFNALIFVGSLLFIGVFFAYTMNDTAIRGTMDRYNGVHVDPDTGERAPGGIPSPIPGEQLEEGMPGAEAEEAEHTGEEPPRGERAPAVEEGEAAPLPAEDTQAAEQPAGAEAQPDAEEAATEEGATEEGAAPVEEAQPEPEPEAQAEPEAPPARPARPRPAAEGEQPARPRPARRPAPEAEPAQPSE